MIVEAREVWLKDGEKLILRSPMATDAALLLQNLAVVCNESYRNMNHPKGYWDEFPLASSCKR